MNDGHLKFWAFDPAKISGAITASSAISALEHILEEASECHEAPEPILTWIERWNIASVKLDTIIGEIKRFEAEHFSVVPAIEHPPGGMPGLT